MLILKGLVVLNKRIYLSSPTMHGEEQQYIKEAFDANWVAPLGKNVDEFEREIADYVGIKSAAALSAGTAALHLACKLCGIGEGDIVFCSDLTFAATVNPVSYERGRQVFIDSEKDSWNMDPDALLKAFQKYKNPKAVVLVNLYGTPSKLSEIKEICDHYNVPLIEDAAESLGASYRDKQTGTFGKYGVFSFNGNKIITTSGGGMLVSDDDEAIKTARFLATQARDPAPHYQHSTIGYNYRMSNIVAGIGRGQLLHLGEHIALKKEIYNFYRDELSSLPVKMNPFLPDTKPNFWLSAITVEKEGIDPYDLMNLLAEENIESRPIWKPMHMQPVFKDNDFISVSEKPVSEEIFKKGLCLPSDIKMTPEDKERILTILKKFFKQV